MVIGLLMKEVFGMRLDSVFYNNIIGVFDLYMNKIFLPVRLDFITIPQN